MPQELFHLSQNQRRRSGFDTMPLAAGCRRVRVMLLAAALGCWALVVIWRLASIQLSDAKQWRSWAMRQHSTSMRLASERGRILDRNGKMLAVSVPAGSVFVRPRELRNASSAAIEVARVLELPVDEVEARLRSDSPFVWIRRQLPRAQAEEVRALGIAGIDYVLEARRYYPFGPAAAALIGKVGIDGVGLSGLERQFEAMLHRDRRTTPLRRDAFGNMIEQLPAVLTEADFPKGDSLQLTLDASLQSIVDEEIQHTHQRTAARHVVAVLIEAHSGDILAMSQTPQFDLNQRTVPSNDLLRNLVVETVYEPGSTLKPLIAGAALQAKVVGPNELLNCENGRMRFSRHTIKDVHGHEDLSVHEVVVRSSNIGMTKIGLRLGKQDLYAAIDRFGFGATTGVEVSGESKGILRTVDRWAPIDVATHSFGQGIAVTPLQIVRGIAAVASGGILPSVKLIKSRKHDSQRARRVLSPEVAQQIQAMMVDVVSSEHGTGKRAHIEGVRIGGKTGTAQKARTDGRGYAPGKYVASFVGFADAAELGIDQQLVLLIAVDEPNTTSIYGGTLAAPAFKRIMQRALHELGTRKRLRLEPRAHSEARRSGALLRTSYRPSH